MTVRWDTDAPPLPARPGLRGYLRAVWRGIFLALVVFGGLASMILLRLVERPLFGLRRPFTPWITQWVCRSAFVILGITHNAVGERMKYPGAVVANHASWLDIFALNAGKRVYFVSKAEVARWPVIGWLARATGTVFITRDAKEAGRQKTVFETRLKAGHKLLFFPEGTSSDGRRILPFKSTLFAAFFTDALQDKMHIQPVTVLYHAPPRTDPRFYGWWGDMNFAGHLLKILANRTQGSVDVIYHTAVPVSQFDDRKHLARYCENVVREGFEVGRPDIP